MIIKHVRLRPASVKANKLHAPLRCTPADLEDLFADARAGGKLYAVRHIIIATPAPTMRSRRRPR